VIFAAAEIKLKPHKTQVLLDTGGAHTNSFLFNQR
jgi:hypothetical protein